MKKCVKCSQEFTPTRPWSKYCSPKCRSNSQVKAKNTKAYQDRRREMINTIKVERGCANCGYNKHSAALDFNHRDPSTKSFNVSQDPKVALEKLMKEIDKCDVLCANCHRIHTQNEKHNWTARKCG